MSKAERQCECGWNSNSGEPHLCHCHCGGILAIPDFACRPLIMFRPGHYNKGIKRPPMTEEQRKKLSKARLGMRLPERWRKNIAEGHTGLKHTLERKKAIGDAQRGEKSHSWKGDDVGIHALHAWVNRNKPKPVGGKCEICYVEQYYDLANITGIYDRDFGNYQYLCRSCHTIFDIKNGTRDYGGMRDLSVRYIIAWRRLWRWLLGEVYN